VHLKKKQTQKTNPKQSRCIIFIFCWRAT